jgi:glycosyltransferase involved in cell wall biosynthesis
MPTKAVLLTETISPYRIPVFNEIARSLEGEFLVLFFGESEKRRQWKIYKEKIKFRYEVLPCVLFQKQGLTPYFFNFTLFYKLLKYSPNLIIISGYSQPSSFVAILYAKLFKKQLVLWCESNKSDQRYEHSFKEAYKRWFVKNCAGYIVPGQASFDYLLSLGASGEKIYRAPNAVDNDYFSLVADQQRKVKEQFKQSKGYPRKVVLYVGRLVDQKGIFDLFKAFQIIAGNQPELGLVLIGNGEKEEYYKKFCRINNIRNVFFTGFVQQEELPAYYACADVFVLPTHSEPWGLVLNEAMACKLPVVVSDVAGAAVDLIINGKNGYIYEKGNINKLVETLKKVLNSDRVSMGMSSYEIIQKFSPQKCALGFLEAIIHLK